MSKSLAGLDKFCQSRFGSSKFSDLRRLSGGASMETWQFSSGGKEMILRRLPQVLGEIGDNEKSAGFIPLSLQADLIEVCFSHDIPVPNVLARLTPEDDLGEGFVMEKIGGEALPQKLFKDDAYKSAMTGLTAQAAKALANIHDIPLTALPDSLTALTPQRLVENQDHIYQRIGAKIPVFDYAFGWLSRNTPSDYTPRLVHGDYRLGNLLIDKDGLTSVLDWELSHIGDPLRDVAYMCTPSWRFGRYEMGAGGFDTQDNWLAAYETVSGKKIDRTRFTWWLIFNTLWWGISCLLMGHAYRDESVKTLERTLIGRRVSEVEIDLLLQFEDLRDSESPSLNWAVPQLLPDSQETSYSEIVTAIHDWNQDELMPEAEGLDLFKSRMVRNALGIIERRLVFGDRFKAQHTQRLTDLGASQNELCLNLRVGKSNLEDAKIWDHLRLTSLERISIDQPRYAGFKIAKEKWTLS